MLANSSITELGTRPVGSLLVKYATPAVIAMTASSLYNIVDAIFIGQGVGALAIAGVSLSFPVMQLTAAFGSMIGVGASTLLSVKLGERDNAVGILLPPIAKDSFFETINGQGPLPRKSFSMGEADEKRFYLECRKLF